MSLTKTRYFDDFIRYTERAYYLQKCNLYKVATGQSCQPSGDPLQDTVTIYDTVNRKYAGFSKVLVDLHGERLDRWDAISQLSLEQWAYVYLVHRITGSGASFDTDHGYRNNVVREMAQQGSVAQMAMYLRSFHDAEVKKPIFTSIGNQIPPVPKPVHPYQFGGYYYLCEIAPKLARDFSQMLQIYSASHGPLGIRQGIDWALKWHEVNGLKKFHFVLTAWVMDFADWHSDLMSSDSLCYYGKNALECMDLCFTGLRGLSDYDKAMAYTCQAIETTLGEGFRSHPLDVEDIQCDAIRYWENYYPYRSKHYQKICNPLTLFNASSIQDHAKGRQRWMLGTEHWIW